MTEAARKLATIVALDVAGYSARTEADEAKTSAEVAALRAVVEEIAAARRGRIFNSAGDGFMLEFGSSVDAVEAARELAERCDPKVRVGVHLGDVIVQPGGDLLGHGVNVAARLMARAQPGSALVSAAVRQTIRAPIAERLQPCGVLALDKMAETIEAFMLGPSAGTPPQLAPVAPLAKPSAPTSPFAHTPSSCQLAGYIALLLVAAMAIVVFVLSLILVVSVPEPATRETLSASFLGTGLPRQIGAVITAYLASVFPLAMLYVMVCPQARGEALDLLRRPPSSR